MSRALRVHLRVGTAAERAETHPACRRSSDSRRVYIVHGPDARPRDKRDNGKTDEMDAMPPFGNRLMPMVSQS